ncbi:uncharacterized protein B0P05DRAFT_19145 [Gilbertella persicaria]|uniref:uncharacterized protein n=1 Tax=Gilbertella persicaria TaxID=101096 RepID=UPI00221F2B3B|nr:uncharacterized protein B0P05DRAFT_19145 [Gilbertella persicaria]KAI8087021.1 hypothetical protein B0P05DRAFT_19145 [Gilbertella persicaria]
MTTWFSWLSSRHESISTVIRPKRKEIVLFLVKWTSIILVLGSLVFFSIYQVDLNAHIGWRDYLVPDRPSAGSLSSCFNRQMNKTTHYSLFPSIPVKEFDTCFDYARLIQPFNKSTTTSLFHTYWSTEQSSQLTQNQLATLRSFVATQPANTQLYVWTTPTDQKKLMQDPLWQSIRSNRIQWMSIDTLALQPTDQIEWMVKTHSLYQHGGVWMDLDVLLIRDLSPLLHQEWLSQSSCFEQSTGAMMHFFAGSSYVCEIEQSSKTFRGASVYQQVYRRLLEHHITPWAVLPWCFTDPSQCQSSNSLPDLFRHGVGQEEVHKMMHVFAYHWHEQWHRKPGTLFNYLIELHKKTTTW